MIGRPHRLAIIEAALMCNASAAVAMKRPATILLTGDGVPVGDVRDMIVGVDHGMPGGDLTARASIRDGIVLDIKIEKPKFERSRATAPRPTVKPQSVHDYGCGHIRKRIKDYKRSVTKDDKIAAAQAKRDRRAAKRAAKESV